MALNIYLKDIYHIKEPDLWASIKKQRILSASSGGAR